MPKAASLKEGDLAVRMGHAGNPTAHSVSDVTPMIDVIRRHVSRERTAHIDQIEHVFQYNHMIHGTQFKMPPSASICSTKFRRENR